VQTPRNPSDKHKLTRYYKRKPRNGKFTRKQRNHAFFHPYRATVEWMQTEAQYGFHLIAGGATEISEEPIGSIFKVEE
jgi:hypothetical protein